jgi:hypothetical protein
MNICPHCNAGSCLAWPRKLFMGPTAVARCRVCGFRVGLDPARATIPLLLLWTPPLLLVALGALGAVTNPLPWLAFWMLCLILAAVLNLFWAPLMPKELPGPAMVEAGRARIAAEKAARRKA